MTRRALEDSLLLYSNEGDRINNRPRPAKPHNSTILQRPCDDHVAEMFGQSRTLMALATAVAFTGEERFRDALARLVEGLRRAALFKDD